ncbi:hypothetical protein ACUSRQ_003500 [Vibrio harveyi]
MKLIPNDFLNSRVTNLMFVFLLVPSSFYIYGFFPAPYYLSFVIALFFLVFFRKKIVISHDDFIVFLIGFVFFVYIFSTSIRSNYNELVFYLMSMIVLSLTLLLKNSYNAIQKLRLLKFFLFFSATLFSFDLAYRIATPDLEYLLAIKKQGVEFRWFYAYKHSFLFQDSNFSALVLSAIVMLVISKRCLLSRKCYFIYLSVFLLLLIMTFSRSSIISTVFVILCLIFTSKVKGYIGRYLLLFPISFLVTIFIYLKISDFSSLSVDASLFTKFYLLHVFLDSFANISAFDMVFGWGLGNSINQAGVAAHNLYFTIIWELGFVGLILYSLFFISLIIKYPMMLPCFLVVSISSLSFGLMFPPLFAVYSMFILTNDR